VRADEILEHWLQKGPLRVNGKLRRASVAALIELGRSDDYRDRADAGQGLAGFAETREAAEALLELMLDKRDTFVTLATAEAALRRKDRIGLAVVASALAGADPNHDEWLCTAVENVFGVFSGDRDVALRLAEELTLGRDEQVSLGARELIEILTDLDPVLRPE
jgi:hypothetical protein